MIQERLKAQEVQSRIQQLEKLETSPFLAQKMMRYIDSPRTSVSVLSKWIAMDQVLAARVLKLANSINYGFSGQISTLNLAIVVIGFEKLRDLLMGISVIDQFAETPFPQADPLQIHSSRVAAGARYLAGRIGYPVIGEAYVAGLLHDIGHRVLLQEYVEEFKEAVHLSKIKNIPYHLAEKEILGVDHTQIGAWLLQAWRLPESLIRPIRFHHAPEQTDRDELVQLIHLSDLICYSMDDDDIRKDPCLRSEIEQEILEKLKSCFSINHHSLGYFQKHFRSAGKRVGDNFHRFHRSRVRT